MHPIPIAGPAVEPVTLAEMRSVLRLDDAAEDDFVTVLIKAARRAVEDLCGCRLIEQTWRQAIDRWPPSRIVALPLFPIRRVERVRLFDANGVPSDVSASLYHVHRSDPPRLVVDLAAPEPGRAVEGIEIDIVAGFGAGAADVPPPLAQAVRQLVALWFEHRGDAPREAAVAPAEIAALVAPYRRRRIA